MNIPSTRSLRRIGATLITGLLASPAFSQGSLTPPAGAPGPTQKSLQQIWDKIAEVEAKTQTVQNQLAQESATSALLLENAGVTLPWQTGVIDTIPRNLGTTLYRDYSLSFGIATNGISMASWSRTDQPNNGYATWNGPAWNVQRETALYIFYGPPVLFGEVELRRGSMGFTPSGQTLSAGIIGRNIVLRYLGNNVFTNTLGVVSTLNDPYNVNLAVGADGSIFLMYSIHDGTDYQMYFVKQNGAGWTHTLVAPIEYGYWCSMRLSPAGIPTIAYVDTEQHLAIAELGTSGWATNTVDATQIVWDTPDLAFGPDGQPAIAFPSLGPSLIVARRPSESAPWTTEILDPSVAGGGGGTMPCSLAFGPSGRPAVVYSYGNGYNFKFARQDASGTWQYEELQGPSSGSGIVGRAAILRYTRQGYPLIVYFDDDTSTLQYKLRAPFTGQ